MRLLCRLGAEHSWQHFTTHTLPSHMQAMQVQNLIHDLSAKKGKRPINISRSSVKTFFKRSFMLSLAYITSDRHSTYSTSRLVGIYKHSRRYRILPPCSLHSSDPDWLTVIPCFSFRASPPHEAIRGYSSLLLLTYPAVRDSRFPTLAYRPHYFSSTACPNKPTERERESTPKLPCLHCRL